MNRAMLAAWICSVAGIIGCAGGGMRRPLDPAPTSVARRVADRVLLDFRDPPPFDWGEGVLMAGMMRAGLVMNEPQYVAFVRRWADHWREKGLAPILAGAPDSRLKGYCGHWGPAFPVLMLYEKTKDPSYLAMVRQVADYVETKATRITDGALGHWNGNRQLWVDTLYMVCPVMADLGRVESRPEHTREAVKQLELFALHCQDAKTGLFYHMYDEPSNRCVGVLWGRGNGWVVMSYVEVLKNLDRRSPEFARLSRDFDRLVAGLTATQDQQTGLWHTVLDRPDSYLETSASAMIVSAFVDGRRLGLIKVDEDRIRRCWAGLVRKVDADGRVIDVSGGTGPAEYRQYADKVRGTETWGTGAFLLAASALEAR